MVAEGSGGGGGVRVERTRASDLLEPEGNGGG